MSVFEDAIPELARAGNWRQYYIQQGCERAYAANVADEPVLEDLLEMLVVQHDGMGVRSAVRLICAVGVALTQLEGRR